MGIKLVEGAETADPEIDVATTEDADEQLYRSIRKDLPGVKGASAAGIVAISVGKTPTKNAFFRTHPTFRPICAMVDTEVGMEKQYFAVTPGMVDALHGIDIPVSDHTLYLTVTTDGAYRVIPVRRPNDQGEQNEYARTKEIGLVQAIGGWVRLSTDLANRSYKVFPARTGRFGDAQWPDLKEAKIFCFAFRDKGRLIDSTEHPLFKKWATSDAD